MLNFQLSNDVGDNSLPCLSANTMISIDKTENYTIISGGGRDICLVDSTSDPVELMKRFPSPFAEVRGELVLITKAR